MAAHPDDPTWVDLAGCVAELQSLLSKRRGRKGQPGPQGHFSQDRPRLWPAPSPRQEGPAVARLGSWPPEPFGLGVSLGEVPVQALAEALVKRHGYGPRQASKALGIGLLAAGYPDEPGCVSAADAFDIIESILVSRP